MAFITRAELRERLPREGSGVTDAQIDEAIESAVEEVTGATGDANGDSAMTRQAAASMAQADILDIIFPRDARREGSASTSLRVAAEGKLGRYLQIQMNKAGDNDPTTIDVPAAYINVVEPSRQTIGFPDPHIP